MSSQPSYILFSFTRVVIAVLLCLLLSPVTCINQHQQPPTSPSDLLFVEKMRLGSTPPSCHNKCNRCHPCMAVQVPTLPSHNRVDHQSDLSKTIEFFDPYPAGNRYSNYKPLGWKCHCGDHFYNP